MLAQIRVAYPLLLSVLLTGCANSSLERSPPTELIESKPSIDLLNCKDSPDIPSRGSTDTQVAIYMINLWEVADDCKSRMDALKKFFYPTSAMIAFNYLSDSPNQFIMPTKIATK